MDPLQHSESIVRGNEETGEQGPPTLLEGRPAATEQTGKKIETHHPDYAHLLAMTSWLNLLSGIAAVMIQKGMNRLPLETYTALKFSDPKHHIGAVAALSLTSFSCPVIQTFLGYLGTFLCWAVYSIDMLVIKIRNPDSGRQIGDFDFPKRASSTLKPPSPMWVWILPALLEFLSSILINKAMLTSPASTVQLILYLNISNVALLSVLLLRQRLALHEWMGVMIIATGAMLAALFSLFQSRGDAMLDPVLEPVSALLRLPPFAVWSGLLYALLSTVLTSFKLVYEELIMHQYYVPPLRGAGIQGAFGVGIAIAVMLADVFWLHRFGVEIGLLQLMRSQMLFRLAVAFVLSMFFFNASSIIITKISSSIWRMAVHAVHTVGIYLVELSIGWSVLNRLDVTAVVLSTIGLMTYLHLFPSFGSKSQVATRNTEMAGYAPIPTNAPEEGGPGAVPPV